MIFRSEFSEDAMLPLEFIARGVKVWDELTKERLWLGVAEYAYVGSKHRNLGVTREAAVLEMEEESIECGVGGESWGTERETEHICSRWSESDIKLEN